MKDSEAALLFSARIGGSDALLYLLLEHQHSEAPLMGLRLLSYMVRIWKRQFSEICKYPSEQEVSEFCAAAP